MAKDQKKPVSVPKATKCPVTREKFEETARPMLLSLTGGNVPEGERVALAIGVARHKDKDGNLAFGFSTGSFGWGASDKITIMVDGVPVKVQASVNLTVVGSKDAES